MTNDRQAGVEGVQSPSPSFAELLPAGIFRRGCRGIFLGTAWACGLFAVSNLSGRAADATNATREPAQFVVRSWQVDEGLPHNSVNAVLQTRDGYLWVATDDGLARFDGMHFKVFGLREGLPSLQALVLLEDKRGALWIGTRLGLSRFADGKFETWTTKDGLAGNEVSSLALAADDSLFVGTTTGLSRWHEGKFRALEIAAGIFEKRVRTLATDAAGKVCASIFYQGLLEWNDTKFAPVARPNTTPEAAPYCVLFDRRGNLWAGLPDGIVLCRTNGGWRQYGAADGLPTTITCLAEGPDGSIWAGLGRGGLFCFPTNRAPYHCPEPRLLNEGVRSLWFDREGNLWVGTIAAGLIRLKPQKLSVLRMADGAVEAVAQSLAETPGGVLWAGTTSRGLFRIQDGSAERFPRGPPVQGYPYVSAVLTARDGSLWWGAGPAVFQWQDGKFLSAYTSEYRSWLRQDRIRALCEDRAGGLWIGTQNGQLRLLRDGQFIAFTNAQPGAPVTALLQQDDGTLLVGTYGKGLLRLRNGERTAETNAVRAVGLFILTLHRDANGVLWIGTEGDGLSWLDAGRATTLTAKSGLTSDTIVQILEDDAGFLWLGSYRGILRVAKRELKEFAAQRTAFVHPLILDRSDGMATEQCMRGFHAGLKTSAGRLHFATAKEIVVVDPKQHLDEVSPPAVWFEEMVVDEQVQRPRVPVGARGPAARSGTPEPPGLLIPPGKRRVEFRYTGLSLSAPESVRFRYKLEGLDERWIEAGLERVATYSLLPAGSYRFTVTACNNSGIWNEQVAAVSFQVLPFFWQTWWFRSALGAGAVVLVGAIVRYVSFRRLRRQLEILEQEAAVQKDRARIAKDLHDDLGANLSQIAMLSELAQTDYEKPAQARGHIDQIFRTARTVTRSLDEIVWAVSPRNDSLDRFAAHLCTYAPEYLRAAGVRCRLDVPLELPATRLPANVRHHLYLAFKEALHNVVKHAGATEVWLRLSYSERELSLVIEDNGRGFQSGNGAATGEDGLDNLRQRMLEIGGRFEQLSQPGHGTCTALITPWLPNDPQT